MDMDDDADVAALKPVRGNIDGKHNGIVFLHFANLPFKGYAVTSRGMHSPGLTSQTDLIGDENPAGEAITPSTFISLP